MLRVVEISMDCIRREDLTTEAYMDHNWKGDIVPLDGRLALAFYLLECAPRHWVHFSKST